MASKNRAWDQLTNPKAPTRESLLSDIYSSIATQESYEAIAASDQGKSGFEMSPTRGDNARNSVIQEASRRNSLINLYKLMGDSSYGGGSGSGEAGDRGAGGPQAPVTVTGMPAPGQDAYSQKMLSMSTGKYDASDPSYKWRFDEGQRALERSHAAKGLNFSGNVATALVGYGQGMASTEYAAEFDRMMKAAGLVTTQYDSAIRGLAAMANIDYNRGMLSVANRNADANMVSAQASGINAGTNSRQQRFGESVQAGKDAAGRDALYQMYSQPTQQSAPVSSSSSNSGGSYYTTYSTPPYSSSGTDSLGNANSGGSWSSSSGGGGEWSNGSYSGD